MDKRSLIAIAGLAASANIGRIMDMEDYLPIPKMPKVSRRYQQMITSTDEEIAAHNTTCITRQVRRYEERKAHKKWLATHKR